MDPIAHLSLAAPAYNEAEGIADIVTAWHRYLSAQSFLHSFEIVICNDGSTDQTGAVLEALTATIPQLRIVHLPRNQGAAAALAQAIAATRLEWVLLIDADGQFPIENLSAMIAAQAKQKTWVVSGIRQKKSSLFARIGSQLSGAVCNIVHGSRIQDFNSAFKLVHGPLVRSLVLEAKGMNYSTEMTSRLLEKNIAITEIAIDHQPRLSGKSHMNMLRDGWHRILFVFYLAFRQGLMRLHVLRRPS